jgi:hypothetical protein
MRHCVSRAYAAFTMRFQHGKGAAVLKGCEGCGFGAWEPGMVLGFLHVTLLYSFTSVWFKELDHHTCQGTYSLLQNMEQKPHARGPSSRELTSIPCSSPSAQQ